MKYSQLFTKTRKESPKDETSKNAQLLIRAGFINKEMAGVYAYLPLGLRVLNKISNILRAEINNIGGQEILMSALQDPEVWQKTDRWSDEAIDVWFRTNLNHGGEIGLGNTHEEPLAQMMTHHIESYADLPKYVYQFQTKFRNEVRSKSGILRTREFIMKDLYSFNKSEEELEVFYEKARGAYTNFFKKIGLGDITYYTFASGGAFAKFSHEFQTICDAGEDTIYVDEEKNMAVNKEVYTDEILNDLGLDKSKLVEKKSIEVGNIFKLKTRFSEPLGLTFVDEDGEEKPVMMGSYGIGPGRAMGTIVETHNDENGIIWPESVAPFKVHLVGLNLEDEQVRSNAEELYNKLEEQEIEVLFDDREDTPAGQKFADADLIGCPYRAVISKKTDGKVEVKKRSEDNAQVIEIEKLFEMLG